MRGRVGDRPVFHLPVVARLGAQYGHSGSHSLDRSEGTTELIPVTEERWNELRDLKAEGQSYDELLGLLVQEHRRRRLTDATDRGLEDDPQAWIEE